MVEKSGWGSWFNPAPTLPKKEPEAPVKRPAEKADGKPADANAPAPKEGGWRNPLLDD